MHVQTKSSKNRTKNRENGIGCGKHIASLFSIPFIVSVYSLPYGLSLQNRNRIAGPCSESRGREN
jgi:hypothetical protein